jgi:hypothetical protein
MTSEQGKLNNKELHYFYYPSCINMTTDEKRFRWTRHVVCKAKIIRANILVTTHRKLEKTKAGNATCLQIKRAETHLK